MDIFGQIEQKSPVFTGFNSDQYVTTVAVLPEAGAEYLNKCFLVAADAKTKGSIYICKYIDNVYVWVPVKETEHGVLEWKESQTYLWKRLAPDAIIIHWRDPEDVVDLEDKLNSATWNRTVVVRKRGSAPQSIHDGEVVGSSTVRNQYAGDSLGFTDELDRDDIDYYYRLFAVTVGGVVTASATWVVSNITWDEIKSEIDKGTYKRMFRVGDIFPMPTWTQKIRTGLGDDDFTTREFNFHAQIVDFDHNGVPGITFMTVEVINNMSFDNKELQYAISTDHYIKSKTDGVAKEYFLKRIKDEKTGEYMMIPWDFESEHLHIGSPVPDGSDDRYPYNHRTWADGTIVHKATDPIYEKHPSVRYFSDRLNTEKDPRIPTQTSDKTGVNCWFWSNIRAWLTSPSGAAGVSENLSPEWINEKNGWFSAAFGDYHNVAPGSSNTATYIETPVFQEGFDEEGKRFLALLAESTNITITDEFVYRYDHGNAIETEPDDIINKGKATQGALESTDLKFWIPSFEEIYGRRPINGYLGEISSVGVEGTTEGNQFEFFKTEKGKNSLVKYWPGYIDENDQVVEQEAMAWYLRSCDPTTPGRVFYVGAQKPADEYAGIELTCAAHRSTVKLDADPEPLIKVGVVACFNINRN